MLFLFIEVDGKTVPVELKNAESVKVIMRDDVDDCERHINITHEGVIIDLVDHANGEVLNSYHDEHQNMVSLEEDDE